MNWRTTFSRVFNFLRCTLLCPSHLGRISRSRRLLAKLRSTEFRAQDGYEARVIGYLRRIDPYLFEELTLSAFESRGHFVLRNTRYSGDGGLDGKVRYQGRWWPIQCKRYSLHVNRQQLLDFERELAERNTHGLFVHSGKTGKQTYENHRQSRTRIISGRKLITLITASREG